MILFQGEAAAFQLSFAVGGLGVGTFVPRGKNVHKQEQLLIILACPPRPARSPCPPRPPRPEGREIGRTWAGLQQRVLVEHMVNHLGHAARGGSGSGQ